MKRATYRWCLMSAAIACGGDDAEGDTSTTGVDTTSSSSSSGTSTSSSSGGSTTEDASSTSDDPATSSGSGATSSSGDTSSSGPPVLVQIVWEHAQPCMSPQAREVTVTVTVEDPDTPADQLSFAGGIAGCDGEIDAAISTLTCTGSSNHVGAVTITDPEGGSDDGAFTVIVCQDGAEEY
jgi:hypothetical protein